MAWAQDPRAPVILTVEGPFRLSVGEEGTVSLTYRAPRANVVAIVWAIVEAPERGRPLATAQRELPVVARAYGKESGTLTLPVRFATTGLKRVTLVLVTDDGVQSEPRSIALEVTE